MEDPDDPDDGLRFIPETRNTGPDGGAYLLLGLRRLPAYPR
jgi:hypothetical protein